MTREETLAFISYLQKKEEVLIESQVIQTRTMFHPVVNRDFYMEAEQLLHVIKKSENPEDAYKEIAHISAKQNPRWKEVPISGHLFLEDFEKSRELQEQTGDIRRYLISRKKLISLFPTEYMNFCHETSLHTEERYSVQRFTDELTPAKAYQSKRYRFLMQESELKERLDGNHLLLFFDSKRSDIKEEDLVTISKWICENFHETEVTIRDYEKDEMVVVRKR